MTHHILPPIDTHPRIPMTASEFHQALQEGQKDFSYRAFNPREAAFLFDGISFYEGLCFDHSSFAYIYATGRKLTNMSFRGANLHSANFDQCHLQHIDFSGATLTNAYLENARIEHTSFQGAYLGSASFVRSAFSMVDFTDANIMKTDFEYTKFEEEVIGLPDPKVWLDTHLEHDAKGWIAYKIFGAYHEPDPDWIIQSDMTLYDPHYQDARGSLCSRGIHSATPQWLKDTVQSGEISVDSDDEVFKPLWRIRLRFDWLEQGHITVPYATDGKIRSRYIELMEPVWYNEFFLHSLYRW